MSDPQSLNRPLVLVDGSSYLYRAFHALPELTTASGVPTGAVYGVLTMLNKLLREVAPEHIAIIFDAPGKTFRDAIYKDYKANRPPMPDALKSQIEPLIHAIQTSGLPLLSIQGVEADDVIGTLTNRAVAEGMSVLIVTGDKDMAQLVQEKVTLLDTMPRGPNRTPRETDANGVIERFGVRADQIIDYLGLIGDSSDNIPGVPKIGSKTAQVLLEHFEHVEDILSNLEAVAELPIRGAKGVAQRIVDNRELLLLSRDLATIRQDVDIKANLDDLRPDPPNLVGLRDIYEKLELRRLLESLPESESPASAPVGKFEFEAILSDQQFTNWLNKIEVAELVGFDTETTSINYMEAELVGLSFAVGDGDAAYLPVAHAYPDVPDQLDRDAVLQRLKPWLESAEQAKIGHHLKYDAHVLMNYGIRLGGMCYDSMLESYVLDSTATRHDLDSVARKYLDQQTIHYEDVAGKGAKQLRFDEVPIEQATAYAAEDADVTLRLHKTLWPKIESTGHLAKLYTEIEQPLVEVLKRMEESGVQVDAELLGKLSHEFAEKMTVIEARGSRCGRPSLLTLAHLNNCRKYYSQELQLPCYSKNAKRATIDGRRCPGRTCSGLPVAAADPRLSQPEQAEVHLY